MWGNKNVQMEEVLDWSSLNIGVVVTEYNGHEFMFNGNLSIELLKHMIIHSHKNVSHPP